MAPLQQLDAYLATNSYLGSANAVTLEDYKQCKDIPAASIDDTAMPHLHRWHAHVSFLMEKFPKFDYRYEAIPQGKPPALGKAEPPAKKEAPAKKEENYDKEDKPKQVKPKQEAKPKKEAAPKKEAKKEGDAEKAPTPEELEKMKKDTLKKVIKEGGKRGVEIEGAADMGGLQFFCTAVDLPQGDLELLLVSMEAMNEKSDPTQEERKGGSGHIGKMIFSAGIEQLGVVAYVPEAKHGELNCKEWLEAVLANFQGKVASSAKDVCSGFVKTDSDKGVFPLKIREALILEANNFLRKKGLFPEDDSDDDEMVFGDDDFPSM